MAGEGGYLRRARLMNGWTLVDLEDITKIKRSYLHALEVEAYEELPGDAYTRGFLRNYARVLGLDPDEILGMYTEDGQRSQRPQRPQRPPAGVSPGARAAAVPLKKSRMVSVPAALLIVAVLVACVGMGYYFFQGMGSGVPKVTHSGNEGNFQAQNNQQTIPDSNSDQSSQVVSAVPITVRITFNEACWLVVKADNATMLDGYVEKGTVRTVTAYTAIEFVSVGNPSGITVNFNGKDLPQFGSPEQKQQIDNLVLTADS